MSFPPDVPLLEADSVELLWASDFLPTLVSSLEGAASRVEVAMFIASTGTATTAQGLARELLDVLARAQRRGVECRVILNDFAGDPELPTLNLVAAHYLDHAGVPVRLFRSDRRSSVHSKYVVIDDDIAIVGSGNWSGGGLVGNLEASVRVVSSALVVGLRRRFDGDWSRAGLLGPLL